MKKLLLVVLLYFFALSHKTYAEGTNPVSPNVNNISALLLSYDRLSGAYFNCPEDNRLYFNIKDHSKENLFFGFDWRQYTSAGGDAPRLENLYYRIRKPNGAVIAGPALWNPTNLPIGTGGAGVINSYTSAFNGPNIGTVTTGYTPLVFDPAENGNFWIEFYRSDDNGATMITTGTTGFSGTRAIAPLFDLTVADNTTFQVKKGRLHSDKWAFLACEPNTFRNISEASASPIFYAYTTDSVTVKIDIMDGFKPIAYDFAVNSYGVSAITTSNPFTSSRNSRNDAQSPSLKDGYKVFLNVPDPAIYVPGHMPAVPQFASPAIMGCGPYYLKFITSDPGDVKIFLNLNGIPGYQPGTADRYLEAFSLPAGINSVVWDGRDGMGSVVAGGTTVTLTVTVLKGRFNVPIYDAEINSGGITIDIITPYFGRPDMVFWNDALLTNVGSSCGGTDDNQNNITGAGLDNSFTGVTAMPTRAWSGNGNMLNVVPAPVNGTNETDGIQCSDFGNVRTLNLWGWGVTVNSNTIDITFGCPVNTTYAINDEHSTWINTPVSGNVKTNDFDLEGNTQAFGTFLNQATLAVISSGVILSGVSESGSTVANAGTITFNANADYTFTPATNFTGTVSVPYKICDDATACDTAYLQITVSPMPVSGINSVIANNDENISYGLPVNGNISENDRDPQGDPFSVTSISVGSVGTSFTLSGIKTNGQTADAGTMIIYADGTYTFNPAINFAGKVTLNYSITDAQGATSTATIRIRVIYDSNGPDNNPPFAGDDFLFTNMNVAVNGYFFTNDNDSDGDQLSLNNVTIITGGANTPIGSALPTQQGGTVIFYANGTYLYTPPLNYVGPDLILYTICDLTSTPPGSRCSNATIHFLVAPVLSVRGTVYNDVNGMTDNLVNGFGTDAGGLNAVLVGSGLIVKDVTAVNGNGSYQFHNILSGNYFVMITSIIPTVGAIAPSVSIPLNWVHTGEGTVASGDGNADGRTNIFTVALAGISNVNFGIEQLPEPMILNSDPQYNPGGTLQVEVPPAIFGGTDPDNGHINALRIIGLPIEATSIVINGTLFNASNFPGTGVQLVTNNLGEPTLPITVDPLTDGLQTIEIPYIVVDNAIQDSKNTGLAIIPFTTALPVTWANFTAQKNKETVTLLWQTLQESNTDYFVVEHSVNNRFFNAIGRVTAAGNSTQLLRYFFDHVKPVAGINYYRLKQVDKDGRFKYSETRIVKFDNGSQITVNPNPVKDMMNISFPDHWVNRDVTLKLFNSSGQLVFTKNIVQSKINETLEIEKMPNGSYILQAFQNEWKPETIKIQIMQ